MGLKSGMEGLKGLMEMRATHMGIPIGATDARMAQHFLNNSQIGSIIEEMGGKRVAKSMGKDCF